MIQQAADVTYEDARFDNPFWHNLYPSGHAAQQSEEVFLESQNSQAGTVARTVVAQGDGAPSRLSLRYLNNVP
jgi:hypothetical protein